MNTQRVVVVLGGSRGWGRSCVERFSEPSSTMLIGFSGNRQAAEGTAELARQRGASAEIVQADLGSPAGVDEMFEGIRKHCDWVDVMVYNAFAPDHGGPLHPPDGVIERALAVGALGFLRSVEHTVELMEGRSGRIVVTGSIGTQRIFTRDGTSYFALAAAKAVQEVAIKYLAVELGERDITINMVAGGWIDPQSDPADGEAAERAIRMARRTPLGRPYASLQEMSDVVYFLASPAASWMTGQVVTVDGGLTLL